MKLDVNVLRYMTKEEFRVLTAVEMGQKNVRLLLFVLIACPPLMSGGKICRYACFSQCVWLHAHEFLGARLRCQFKSDSFLDRVSSLFCNGFCCFA
jgi:hypothetical protein